MTSARLQLERSNAESRSFDQVMVEGIEHFMSVVNDGAPGLFHRIRLWSSHLQVTPHGWKTSLANRDLRAAMEHLTVSRVEFQTTTERLRWIFLATRTCSSWMVASCFYSKTTEGKLSPISTSSRTSYRTAPARGTRGARGQGRLTKVSGPGAQAMRKPTSTSWMKITLPPKLPICSSARCWRTISMV